MDNALSILTIDLDAVRRNYLSLQKRLARGSDCAAVVKADGYGLGAIQVSKALYESGCRHFYVAHLEEGAVLREAMPDATIYVLHGGPAKEIRFYNLIPVINTEEDLEKCDGPCVVHIDTGMNRLGLDNLPDLKGRDVRYIMSHLSCADEKDNPVNHAQLDLLLRYTRHLPHRLSIANSSGIFLGKDYHLDQVRPGCALYGINPTPNLPNPMQDVVTLQARILQTREAISGTVGYGATYHLTGPTKLATISAGYADGLLRSFSPSGTVYIGGSQCPVVGRVSMDTIVADVTHVTPEPRAGDWAEIIGPQQSVDDVAKAAGTIGYEILTALGARYKRVYSGEGS